MRLLLVEDDAILRDGLVRALQQSGYVVESAGDGDEAERLIAANSYDLLVLDLGLPKRGGVEILSNIRSRNDMTPIMIITARDSITDRVVVLDSGADDYLIKPFHLAEFEARIRVLARRLQGASSNCVTFGQLQLDVLEGHIFLLGEILELSDREFNILEELMLNAGHVVSKSRLISKLCDEDGEIGVNAIEVYVHRLRAKLAPSNIQIRTIRGLGYMLG